MGVISESPVMSILGSIDEVLSYVGISNPLYDKVMEAEFEPDRADQQVTAINQGTEQLNAALSGFSGSSVPGAAWSGPGREEADKSKECVVTYGEMVGDMYITLAEIIVQVLDYLIDIIRFIVQAVQILLGILIAIITVALAAAFFTGGASLVAAAVSAAAAMGTTFFAVVGLITAVALLGGLIAAGLNWLIEQLQDALANARERGCLKGKEPLPDWDPDPWELPV